MAETTNNKINNGGRITLADASLELSNLFIKLYKEKTFIRSGKDLADKLFECGLEGGSLVGSIPLFSDRALKINAINQALLKINQARYILNAMLSAEFYTASQVNHLLSYLDEIIKGLKQLLDSIPAPQRKITVKSPAVETPAPKATKEVAVQKKPQQSKTETRVANTEAVDDDGFNDDINSSNELYLSEYASVDASKN
jgi:hypothetical protein